MRVVSLHVAHPEAGRRLAKEDGDDRAGRMSWGEGASVGDAGEAGLEYVGVVDEKLRVDVVSVYERGETDGMSAPS
jgi:hypothetical protein